MKRGTVNFLIGFLSGVVMFGGITAFAASGIMAQLSDQPIYVDGKSTELTAYNIRGSNYVMLRDIGRAVGFNVYWDGKNVHVESDKPYTGGPPEDSLPEETATSANQDYSLSANASVFNEVYTREAYNSIRHAIVTKQNGSYFTFNKENRRDYNTLLSHIGVAYRYELGYQGDGYICTVEQPEIFADAVAAVSDMIEEINKLPSDADKVRYINNVICDKLTYKSGASAAPSKVFTTDGVTEGNCFVYSRNFQFLCDLADVPCVLVSSENHGWNMVYIDGSWLYVDCVANDVADELSSRNALLMADEGVKTVHIDIDPRGTAFAMELLVPNSTK